MNTHPKTQPNLFDLHYRGVHVQYSASGIDGKPRLTYRDTKRERTFAGDEIVVADTAAGRMVTVVLEAVPDLQTLSFSFFVPTISIEREEHVESVGLYTTSRTSIGGPALVKGQVDTWRSITLAGMARAVQF